MKGMVEEMGEEEIQRYGPAIRPARDQLKGNTQMLLPSLLRFIICSLSLPFPFCHLFCFV